MNRQAVLRFVKQVWRRLQLAFLLVLSVLTLSWILGQHSEADPVERYVLAGGRELTIGDNDFRTYRSAASRLGLDLPPFWFAVLPKGYPDTLHRILPIGRRRQARALLKQGANWPSLEHWQDSIWSLPLTDEVLALRQNTDLQALLRDNPALAAESVKSLLPAIHWYGSKNQFAVMAASLFGEGRQYSFSSGRPVGELLWLAFKVSLPIAIFAMLMALLFSIPLGLWMGRKEARGLYSLNYVLVSVPRFWLGTAFLLLFTGSGSWFAGPGWPLGDYDFVEWLRYAMLPALVLALPAMSYLALLLAGSLKQGDWQPMRDFGRINGRSERQLWWRDMLRIGMVPAWISGFVFLVRAMLAGSVVLEYIFNIPGLGRLLFEAITTRDWPVLMSGLMWSALLTLAAYLLIDVLNAFLDPRWRLTHHSDEQSLNSSSNTYAIGS